MPVLNLDHLLAAAAPGGSSCLTSTTELAPAGGAHASVAPAKFAPERAKSSVYAYERRYHDGELRHAVLIDSKQSQLNRAEAALDQAIQDGHPVLSRLPRVRVTYRTNGRVESFTDLTLPHRVFDAHVRAGTVDGAPATDLPAYRTVRDATPANARALMETSPITLVYGGWDASRRARQGRWRSALTGHIIGFCADDKSSRRGGARVDPVGMSVKLDGKALKAIADGQRDELSPGTYKKIADAVKKAKADERISGSTLGLGGIPPTLNQLAGVACDPIIRTHVLSFATLRQMRFGAGVDGDAACRALLAALALNGLARSDAELYLRADCDLVEAAATAVTLDQRGGQFLELEALTIEAADSLLRDALAHAEKAAGVIWSGVVIEVDGNPDILSGAADDEGEEQ